MPKKTTIALVSALVVGGIVGTALWINHEKKEEAAEHVGTQPGVPAPAVSNLPAPSSTGGCGSAGVRPACDGGCKADDSQSQPTPIRDVQPYERQGSGNATFSPFEGASASIQATVPQSPRSGELLSQSFEMTPAEAAVAAMDVPRVPANFQRAINQAEAPQQQQQQQQQAGSQDPSAQPAGFAPAKIGSGVTFSAFNPSSMNPMGPEYGDQARQNASSVHKLMPKSWRNESDHGKDEWSKYIPSKEKFQSFLSASGSARQAQSDRSQTPSRLLGADYSGRPRAALPATSGGSHMGDSSFRQDMARQAMLRDQGMSGF
jgi:hypothetical protein